jgi:hypothetical protein
MKTNPLDPYPKPPRQALPPSLQAKIQAQWQRAQRRLRQLNGLVWLLLALELGLVLFLGSQSRSLKESISQPALNNNFELYEP